jgi:hypothetical protein
MALEERNRAGEQRSESGSRPTGPVPTTPGEPDPQLQRIGRRLSAPGVRFLAIGLLPLVAGVLLLVLTSGWPWALGIVLVALALAPLALGTSLLLGGGIAGWAARRRPFA